MTIDPVILAMRGYDPTVRPPVLTEGDVSYVVDETAIGAILLAARPEGTALACVFAPTDADVERVLDRLARVASPRVLRAGRGLDQLRRELDGYLAGQVRTFTVPLDLVLATPFQRQVLSALGEVPYGAHTTYGALALAMGRPSASRAVGAALGANPLCVLLPCHRVIAASGALTGYAGGLDAKQYLLDLEAGT